MRHANRRSIVLALLLAGALAGCARRGPEPPPPPPPPLTAPVDRQAELDAIVALLDQGRTAEASPRIDALLARDPADPQARALRASLDDDPVALLGPKSFAYMVRPGETMLALAERFLGTRLQSYALARYNAIPIPAALAAGTVLHIPGTPPRTRPAPRRPRPVARPRSDTATPATPRTDTAGARQARIAGLAALGQGRIGDAVAALRRAATLNPADPLIRRDLARAERIAGAVRAGR